jgi:hypothetical protein
MLGIELVSDSYHVGYIDYLKDAVRKGRYHPLYNVIKIGFEAYENYVRDLLGNLGLSEKASIEEFIIEKGRISIITIVPPNGELTCHTVDVIINGVEIYVDLNYYVEKDREIWIQRLKENMDDLYDEFLMKFGLEDIDINVDLDIDRYHVWIRYAFEGDVKPRDVERVLFRKIGRIT